MKYFLCLAISFISFCTSGQYYQKRNEQSPLNYSPRQITITLSPIVLQNGKYFFDGRRVKFEDVVLPLVSINDAIVDHRLKVVRTMTDLNRPLHYLIRLYLILLPLHLPPTRGGLDTYIGNIIGAMIFEELYRLSISLVKRSAINRYNSVVLQPTASIMPGGLTLGLTARF